MSISVGVSGFEHLPSPTGPNGAYLRKLNCSAQLSQWSSKSHDLYELNCRDSTPYRAGLQIRGACANHPYTYLLGWPIAVPLLDDGAVVHGQHHTYRALGERCSSPDRNPSSRSRCINYLFYMKRYIIATVKFFIYIYDYNF